MAFCVLKKVLPIPNHKIILQYNNPEAFFFFFFVNSHVDLPSGNDI